MDNYDFSPTKGWTTKEPSSQEPSLPPHFPGNRLKLPAQENVTMPLPHKLSPLPFPPPPAPTPRACIVCTVLIHPFVSGETDELSW